jgi:flavin-dependent dehydrogenase
MKFDAVVVGGRCAGAATALLLARAGARVLVVDKGEYGSDTLSTHALMRSAVFQLDRWGLLPRIVRAGTPPVRSTTFSYRALDVTVAIEERFGVNALYAPRRSLLDRVLVDAAADSGAVIEHLVRVDGISVDTNGRVRGVNVVRDGSRQQIDADWVIGADGLYSTIARLVRARTILTGRHAAAVLYTYWQDLPVGDYYWKFDRAASIGAIPTNDGAVCVFASVSAQRFRDELHGEPPAAYRRWIREVSPAFDARLAGATQIDRVRGFGGHPGFLKDGSGAGWALVGDAGYFKDPITAHGITDALRDAALLARAILQGTSAAMAEYGSLRLDLSRRLFEISDAIAGYDSPDDETLQLLHRAFSSEMSRELRALAALTPLTSSIVGAWEPAHLERATA